MKPYQPITDFNINIFLNEVRNIIMNEETPEQKEARLYKRSLIDAILAKMASINANIGKDSTRSERIKAKWELRKCTNQIKEIDPNFFEVIQDDEI